MMSRDRSAELVKDLLTQIRDKTASLVAALYYKDRTGGYVPVIWDSAQTEDAPPYVSAGSDLAAYLRSHAESAFTVERSSFKDPLMREGFDRFGIGTLRVFPIQTGPANVFTLTVGFGPEQDADCTMEVGTLLPQLRSRLEQIRENAQANCQGLPSENPDDVGTAHALLEASTEKSADSLATAMLECVDGVRSAMIEDTRGVILAKAPANADIPTLEERFSSLELLAYLELIGERDEPLFIDGMTSEQAEALAVLPIVDGRHRMGYVVLACEEWAHGSLSGDVVWAARFAASFALRRKAASQGHQLRRILTSVDNDRARVARELHDETSQNLVALNVRLATAARLLNDGAVERARGIVEDCATIADGILNGVNRLSAELRPSELAYLGLADAIQAAATKRLERSGMKFELTGNAQDAKLSNLQEIMLLNGITEAIANCARHSGASRVQVSMDQDESWLNIAVYDDGRGFDASGMLSRNRNAGVGLRYMRACAESINAEFWVGSVEGAGTTIRFSIPSSAIEVGQHE